jgi:hypothetical protein
VSHLKVMTSARPEQSRKQTYKISDVLGNFFPYFTFVVFDASQY